MNKSKITLVVLILVVAIGIGIFLYQKKDTATTSLDMPAGNTQFAIDDDTAYKQMIDIFKAKGNEPDLEWINKEVAAAYTAGRFKIAGQPSKALSWHNLTYAMSANETGKFTNKDGRKVLWNADLFDDTGRILNALIIKYTLL